MMTKKCENCDKEYKSQQSLFGIVTDTGIFAFFCHECFRKVAPEKLERLGVGLQDQTGKLADWSKFTTKQLRVIEHDLDILILNATFSDPVRMKKMTDKMEELFPDLAKKRSQNP